MALWPSPKFDRLLGSAVGVESSFCTARSRVGVALRSFRGARFVRLLVRSAFKPSPPRLDQ